MGVARYKSPTIRHTEKQVMSGFQRGSEWRRWDLHLHTPGTIKNDLFIGETLDDKWKRFYSEVIAYIGDGSDAMKTIAVIGITDYLSIDNYEKIVADKILTESVGMVIPNVEMRIQPMAKDSPINIHFLFNPQIVNSVEARFFAKLKFIYGDTKFSAMRSELVRLGKIIDSSLSDEVAHKKGIEQFVPSFSDIVEVFSNDADLRENTIILVSNSSSGGMSGAVNHSDYFEASSGESQLKLFRQSVYKFVDGIFSATPTDIEFFLGKKQNFPPDVVIEQCGGLKPCLHGSDAHKNNKIFEPDQKRYCWVKADPTFNGLKQVIYEPEERVRISEIKPEAKPAYLVIDRIEIDDPEFQTASIFFNDKLNCIIGGKSTGKSILLHNLALALDKAQVNKKDETSHTKTKTGIALTVFWADGKSNKDNPENARKTIYVPQTYLNKLCDAQTEKTEIDRLIQDIVLLNTEARESFYNINRSIKDYKTSLSKIILDLLETHRGIDEIVQLMKEIGDRSGIESEKEKLINDQERLTADSSLTGEEIKSYELATTQISTLNSEIATIDSEVEAIHAISSLVEPRKFTRSFSEHIKLAIDEAQGKIISEANKEWEQIKIAILSSLEKVKIAKNDELAKHKTIELGLREKIQSNKALAELTTKIKIESEKLEKLDLLNMQKKFEEQKKSVLLTTVVDSVEFFREQHTMFANTVNDNAKLKTEDLQFSIVVPFRSEAFLFKLSEIFNNKSTDYKKLIKPDDAKFERHGKATIKKIVSKTLSGELPLKQGHTPETALRNIVDDWFEVKYKVTMSSDSLDVMSPGKKALVLLKLLIELAESKCPILIDQPEDDLDNRSIFDELIPFIRKKKKDRQIIIVTHNANIVVGADADEVIVANQHGNNAPNKERRFEYRSGAIENDYQILQNDGSPEKGILSEQGIQQHICDILEGGVRAFELRKQKYHI